MYYSTLTVTLTFLTFLTSLSHNFSLWWVSFFLVILMSFEYDLICCSGAPLRIKILCWQSKYENITLLIPQASSYRPCMLPWVHLMQECSKTTQPYRMQSMINLFALEYPHTEHGMIYVDITLQRNTLHLL